VLLGVGVVSRRQAPNKQAGEANKSLQSSGPSQIHRGTKVDFIPNKHGHFKTFM